MADWPVKKNAAFTVTFPIYDNDGDLVSSAAALDSEVDKDAGGFIDATNEATEVGASGIYKLLLTSTEANADIVTTITKTTTTDAKTAVNVMYTATRQLLDLAFPTTTGRSIDVTAAGEVGLDLDNTSGALGTSNYDAFFLTAGLLATDAVTAAKIAADAIGASEIANGAIDAATFAAGAIDAAAIANSAIDAATFAAGAIDASAIASFAITAAKIGTDAITSDKIAANAIGASEIADGAIDAGAIAADAITSAKIADFAILAINLGTDAITADKVAADTIAASELATSAVQEIRDSILSDSTPFLGASIAAILTDTTEIGVAGAGLTAVPWNAAWDAEVESEVNDALDTAIAELSQAIPTATPTVRTALMLLYMALRNRLDIDTTGASDFKEIYNDAGTVITKKTLTDDGATYSEAEMISGP
ncbi:MAG TPA: hypothetical protein VI729_13135 [Anaerolineales bacterium]|nr:hypothetical protein [Anaerolineales bacterium]